MNDRKIGFLAAASLALILGVPAADAVDKPIVGHFSFGASFPSGDAAEVLDTGWALHGGATWFSPNNPALGLRLDIGLDWWDVKSDFLNQLDTTDPNLPPFVPPDDGDARSWSTTIDLLWNPKTSGSVGFYVIGGAGLYYNSYDISKEGYATYIYCDYWGWCYPVTGTADYIFKDGDSWDWGLNAGVGVTFQLRGGSEFYLEGVYHWIDSPNDAAFIPVTLGWRF
jgi:hypothetical protein